MAEELYHMYFEIESSDLSAAGEASSAVKKKLAQLGINPQTIRRAAVSMYEAELNVVIHANGGNAEIIIFENSIEIIICDTGPGIPDIELAMQEGYSTAPDKVREMGFGAGMGLPNMKRHADKLTITSELGKGTCVNLVVNF